MFFYLFFSYINEWFFSFIILKINLWRHWGYTFIFSLLVNVKWMIEELKYNFIPYNFFYSLKSFFFFWWTFLIFNSMYRHQTKVEFFYIFFTLYLLLLNFHPLIFFLFFCFYFWTTKFTPLYTRTDDDWLLRYIDRPNKKFLIYFYFYIFFRWVRKCLFTSKKQK